MYPNGYFAGDEECGCNPYATCEKCSRWNEPSKEKQMGEQANYIVDQMAEGYWPSKYVHRETRCNKCGSTNVYWKQGTHGKWYICEKGTSENHVCKNQLKPMLAKVKACGTCGFYIQGGRCSKHSITTGCYVVCKDWKEDED